MIKGYKHLNLKSIKKIMFHEKLKSFLKSSTKWGFIAFSLVVLFTAGILSFCMTLDTLEIKPKSEIHDEVMGLKSSSNEEKNLNLDEMSKKELERESEKQKVISDNTKDAQYDFNLKFYDFSDWNKTCDSKLMVVNCENKLPFDFKPQTKICRGKEVGEILADDLEKMISDAKKEGVYLWISSGFRSTDRQTFLFKKQVEREKSKEVIDGEEAEKRAAKVVARPFTSEHNLGLAIDFNGVEDSFYKTKEYKWLMDNAHKYGFIERYQEKWKDKTGVIYEPWHFRYVGKENAPLIKESGLCLEDYVRIKLIGKSEENL